MPSSKPRQRFQDIIDAIDVVAGYVAEAGGAEAAIYRSPIHRDAIERRLLVISEAASKLGMLAEELEPAIPWDAIRGIGNYIRHNYDEINDKTIFNTVDQELSPLRAACVRALSTLPGT